MRAARFIGGGRIELEERPVPEAGPEELLIEVHACAVCGTDRGPYRDGSEVTPGHEIAGTIVAAGVAAGGFATGTRGVVYLVDFCGTCFACRSGCVNMCTSKRRMYGFTADGGYADYVKVDARCFLPVADDVTLDAATTLLDLFGTTAHALDRARLEAGETVGVVGCGPVGLGAVAVARALGAARVVAVDVSGYRLSLAERLGAEVVDASRTDTVTAVRSLCEEGCHVVIEAAGLSATQSTAVRIAAPAGRIVFVAHNRRALELDTLRELIQLERTLMGSEYFPIGRFHETEALVRSGRVDPDALVTHRFSLDDVEQAFETFLSGNSGKVLVLT